MFKKSRIKIVATIMVIVTLLMVGTIFVIYISSYSEMTEKNNRMLERYIRVHSEVDFTDRHENMAEVVPENLPKNAPEEPLEDIPKRPMDMGDMPGGQRELPPPIPEDERIYDIVNIYSVTFNRDFSVKNIDNNVGNDVVTNDELTELAEAVIDLKKEKGVIENYDYLVKETDNIIIVALMDRSYFNRSINTLLKYTIIFGSISMIIVLLVSIMLSNIIIHPLEKNYEIQKQFISDAGHELKTPITVISTNAEVLSEEIGSNKWLNNIIYENEKMTILIKQLLELARTEKNIQSYERVDFSHIVLGEILPFESVAFEKGISIVYDRLEEGICINGSATQLGQVVSILIDNAIEHSTKGNVTVELTRSHGKAILTVANNAKPIPKEKMEMLFERFFCVDDSRNSDKKHYGLGLSIAKSIVDNHKGSIDVESIHGKVIFKVSFKEAAKL